MDNSLAKELKDAGFPQSGAAAHAGAYGLAGAADGDVGGASGYQQLSRRPTAGVCGHAGEGRPHL